MAPVPPPKAPPEKGEPQPASPEKGEQLVHSPKITHFEEPVYPDEATRDRIEGDVVVKVLVGVDGKPIKAEVLRGPEPLRKAALKAAKQARFEPGTMDGKPIKAWVALPYKFRLE